MTNYQPGGSLHMSVDSTFWWFTRVLFYGRKPKAYGVHARHQTWVVHVFILPTCKCQISFEHHARPAPSLDNVADKLSDFEPPGTYTCRQLLQFLWWLKDATVRSYSMASCHLVNSTIVVSAVWMHLYISSTLSWVLMVAIYTRSWSTVWKCLYIIHHILSAHGCKYIRNKNWWWPWVHTVAIFVSAERICSYISGTPW